MRKDLPAVIPISTNPRTFRCGHDGPGAWAYAIEGKRIEFKDDPAFPVTDYPCPECQLEILLKKIIHCCRCGRMIFPGEGIALYTDEKRHGPFQPDHMMTWNRKWIGCMDRTCCPDVNRYVVACWTATEGFSPNRDEDLPPDE